MSKAVKWIVDGAFGRSTLELDFESEVVAVENVEGEEFYITFEGLEDFVGALLDAQETIWEVAYEAEQNEVEDFF